MQHVWPYTDIFQALKGERVSSVFSPDETLISASAARRGNDDGDDGNDNDDNGDDDDDDDDDDGRKTKE